MRGMDSEKDRNPEIQPAQWRDLLADSPNCHCSQFLESGSQIHRFLSEKIRVFSMTKKHLTKMNIAGCFVLSPSHKLSMGPP